MFSQLHARVPPQVKVKEPPAADAPQSPPLLDSLYNANFPKSYDCLVKEKHTDAFTLTHKSRARAYLLKRNREFALHFHNTVAENIVTKNTAAKKVETPGNELRRTEQQPSTAQGHNPRKRIWMRDGGKTIWTLDSLGGRLRKIGAHKKREPMNGPGLNYWLWLPVLYTYPHYSLEEDVMEGPQRRVTLVTEDPNPYQMVRFYLDPESYRVDSLKVYAYGNYLSKQMRMVYGSQKKRRMPDSVIVTDYANQATIRQAFSDCQKLARLPKEFIRGFEF